MFCKAPFLGMTIDPSGLITMCCNTSDRNQFGGVKIEDVDDLEEFFQNEQYEQLRDAMWDEGIEGIPPCSNCWRDIQAGRKLTELHSYSNKKVSTPIAIKYLELTTSNTCNQSCVMCSSYFSSKWRKIEKHFGRDAFPSFHLSDKSVEKIIKILPQLDSFQLKGGEPFADRNNLKFLKVLADENPLCLVKLTSNFQNITDDFMEVMNRLPNLSVSASIDGVGDTFNWIRGGDFRDAARTMQRFFDITRLRISLLCTISVYNINKLNEIREYFKNKEYCGTLIFDNIVTYPDYLSIKHMNQEKLNKIIEEQNLERKETTYSTIISSLNGVKTNPIDYTEKFLAHTEAMNKIRGFNIFDDQPELVDIFK